MLHMNGNYGTPSAAKLAEMQAWTDAWVKKCEDRRTAEDANPGGKFPNQIMAR